MNTDDQGEDAQFEPEVSGGSTSLPDLISEAGIAAVTGLPPQAQRSFWKAFGRVFTAGAEWPANILEGKAKAAKARAGVEVAKYEAEAADIKSQQKARDIVNRGSAKSAVEQFSKPTLAERAVAFHGHHILREQTNREDVLRFAAEDLSRHPPSSDSQSEIDDDWLFMFLREASLRSTEDFKITFGRILSGEIKSPGTFSIETVQVFSKLNKDVAEIFQRACNLSTKIGKAVKIISHPFAKVGQNQLMALGLPYDDFATLVETGLMRSEANEGFDISPHYFDRPGLSMSYAGADIVISKDDAAPEDSYLLPISFSGPSFTKIGSELRNVVTMHQSNEYLIKLSKWLGNHRLILYKDIRYIDEELCGEIVKPED